MTTPQAQFMEAGFAAIDDAYGSTDAYLTEALGFGEDRREALRELLLTT